MEIEHHMDIIISGEITFDLSDVRILIIVQIFQMQLLILLVYQVKYGVYICHHNMQETNIILASQSITGWEVHLQLIISGDDEEILQHQIMMEY